MTPSDWAAEGSFRAFVQHSSAQLLAYLRPVVRESDGIDAEDALQEALIRLAREWDDLPADPASRKNYIYRALRCSAVDAMRKWSGRGSARGRTRPADLELAETIEHLDDDGGIRDPELVSIGQAIYRDAAHRDEAEQAVVRSVLVAALAALKPLEAQVIFGLAGGASRQELADELGIDTNRVRNVAQEARDVLRPLILHANGSSLTINEREQLFRYLDGELRGRDRRLVRRHVAHCATCRAIAAVEREVGEAGARLVLPLPAIGAAAQGAAVVVAGSAAAAGGASGLSAAGGLGFGSAFAGAGTKLAAGLATILVVSAGGAVVIEQQPAKRHHSRSAGSKPAATAAVPTPAIAPTRMRPLQRRTTLDSGSPGRRRASSTEADRQSTPAPSAPTPPTPHRSPSGGTANQQPSPANQPDSGGEFVIGG